MPIREKVTFQVRWEMYNAFNHTQYSDLDAGARFDASGKQTNTQFGQITAARNPSIQQLSLRFKFLELGCWNEVWLTMSQVILLVGCHSEFVSIQRTAP